MSCRPKGEKNVRYERKVRKKQGMKMRERGRGKGKKFGKRR